MIITAIKRESQRTLYFIGNTFLLKGEYDKALGSHKEASKTAVRVNNLLPKSIALSNIELIYSDKGDFDKSLEHIKYAIEIFEDISAVPWFKKHKE